MGVPPRCPLPHPPRGTPVPTTNAFGVPNEVPPWHRDPDWPSSSPTVFQFRCSGPRLTGVWPFTKQRGKLAGRAGPVPGSPLRSPRRGSQSVELLRNREGGPRNPDGEAATSQRTHRPHKRLFALRSCRISRETHQDVCRLFYFTCDLVFLCQHEDVCSWPRAEGRGPLAHGPLPPLASSTRVLRGEPCTPPRGHRPESKRAPKTGRAAPAAKSSPAWTAARGQEEIFPCPPPQIA